MGAGLDPSADSSRLDQHFASEHERATAAGVHSQRDNLVPMTGDARRVLRTIRGGKTSEVLDHVKKQSRLLKRMRWGHR
ncbi:unnamed protein product [Ectocarpus sp. 12 AP-2014]